MKHIKSFENININDIKTGDYVLTNNYMYGDEEWQDYIRSNIGIYMFTDNEDRYNIKYILTPEIIVNCLDDSEDLIEFDPETKERYILMKFEEYRITNISSNIKELELELYANKYNL